jgi:hypothetical protein
VRDASGHAHAHPVSRITSRIVFPFTPTTATLLGETAAEWNALSQQVRAGRRTTSAWSDAARLRVAAELGMVLHVEEIGAVPRRRRRHGERRRSPPTTWSALGFLVVSDPSTPR